MTEKMACCSKGLEALTTEKVDPNGDEYSLTNQLKTSRQIQTRSPRNHLFISSVQQLFIPSMIICCCFGKIRKGQCCTFCAVIVNRKLRIEKLGKSLLRTSSPEILQNVTITKKC